MREAGCDAEFIDAGIKNQNQSLGNLISLRRSNSALTHPPALENVAPPYPAMNVKNLGPKSRAGLIA